MALLSISLQVSTPACSTRTFSITRRVQSPRLSGWLLSATVLWSELRPGIGEISSGRFSRACGRPVETRPCNALRLRASRRAFLQLLPRAATLSRQPTPPPVGGGCLAPEQVHRTAQGRPRAWRHHSRGHRPVQPTPLVRVEWRAAPLAELISHKFKIGNLGEADCDLANLIGCSFPISFFDCCSRVPRTAGGCGSRQGAVEVRPLTRGARLPAARGTRRWQFDRCQCQCRRRCPVWK